ncbi:MAG: hypothetical protein BWY67_02120 [Bacteroidetes bacterium ADurb.Bin397]|nr:MAG: hypothetical protein BWY67_02120 [Bacteroidetes bacterium ADurb.Bin397]
MKKQIKKWTLRLTVSGLLITILLLLIILKPVLTYAGKTTHSNYSVFHHQSLDPTLLSHLDNATEHLKTSEFYNPNLQLDICLNDGSSYPDLMKTLRGPAFAWGFYNKVILQGTTNVPENIVELHGYKWNLTQLLTHEMTHCLQFDYLGLRKSNPIAGIPDWKWEGYAEYISRQNPNQKNLSKNIDRLIASDETLWEVKFEDGTISPREYYNYWTLVQYCMDIKKMSYLQILDDTTSEQLVRNQMMDWYYQRN